MKVFEPKMIITIIFFITAITSGILLTKAGRPLNTAVFTVHKLAAVTAFILLILVFKNNLGNTGSLTLILTITSMVFFLLIIVTGGFLSFDKFAGETLKTVHRILPLITLILSSVSVYLITRPGAQ